MSRVSRPNGTGGAWPRASAVAPARSCAGHADARSAPDSFLSLLELGIGDHPAVMQIGELRELECGAGGLGMHVRHP